MVREQNASLDGPAAEAERLLADAYEAGLTTACTHLGMLHEAGGRSERAAELYREAADVGDAVAANKLGSLLYQSGQASEAFVLFEQSAPDLPAAQYNLALCLERGDGVPRDKARAILLYREAAKAGVDDACCTLGYLLAKDAFRDLEATDPRSVEDGRLAMDEAAVWLRHAADQGVADAMVHLGQIYERGAGNIRRDPNAALALYSKVASSNPEAALYGKGATTFVTAAAATTATLNPNHAPAAGNILYDQLRGDGVGSIHKCVEFFELAANNRGVVAAVASAEAANALGIIYEDGFGEIQMSVPKAQAWYKLAADDGHGAAAYNLAALLERVLDLNTVGVETDTAHRGKVELAIDYYYKRSHQLGYMATT